QTVFDVIFSAWGTLVRVRDGMQFYDAAGKPFTPDFNTDAIVDAVFSPSNRYLLLFREPDTPRIDIIDLKQGNVSTRVLNGEAIQMLESIKISRDEQFVYLVNRSGTGLIWDLDGKITHRFTETFAQLEKEVYTDKPGLSAMAL